MILLRRSAPLVSAVLIGLVILAEPASPEVRTLLEADFDDLPLGSIATGGAALGQPVLTFIGLDADVVAAGAQFPTQSLRLTDQSTSGVWTYFEFLDEEEVTRGTVTMAFDVHRPGPDSFSKGHLIAVREEGGATRSFTDLDLSDGEITVTDAVGAPAVDFPYVMEDSTASFEVIFDLEDLTYTVSVDGNPVVTDRYHFIADRGIGTLGFGMKNDLDTGDVYYVDNILVTHQPPPESVEWLVADFEDKTVGDPVGTGGAAVGEPSSVDSGLDAVVRDEFTGTRQLEILDDSTSAPQAVVFSLVDLEELTSGSVRVRLNLSFEDADTYRVLVLDATSAIAPTQALFVVSFLHEDGTDDRMLEVTDQAAANGGVAFSDPLGERYIIDRGRGIRLEAIVDLDQGTYSLTWDGELLVEDRAYEQPLRGIGRVLLVVDGDADTGDSFLVDRLLVEDLGPFPFFADGFESGDTLAWQ